MLLTDYRSRSSDHNAHYKLGGRRLVTARDFTHDPRGGLDCQRLADALVASGDKRIKYIIWNRRIWTPSSGWKAYSGSNPHTQHLHLSVVASSACEDATPWRLPGLAPTPTTPEDIMATTDELRALLKDELRPVRADIGWARNQILSALGYSDPHNAPQKAPAGAGQLVAVLAEIYNRLGEIERKLSA